MPGLGAIQNAFQDLLLRGKPGLEAHVVGTERVPIATRLGIYTGAYRARLVEALQTNFPALAGMLGEADFEALATEYVRTHDSPFFSIRYYGHALPEFLAGDPAYAAAPVLTELARWEWTMTEVFDAADAVPVGAEALAGLAPELWARLRFEWHPSLRQLELTWNVPQIWKALTREAERPQASLDPEPVHWLLWRRDLKTYFRSLVSAEAATLTAAREGKSFGELCVLLSEHVGEECAPQQAALFLQDWLGSGLIVGTAVDPAIDVRE